MVIGTGPKRTKLVILTDYASTEEVRRKTALQGFNATKVAEYLEQQDTKIRTSLNECYRTSYIKNFVPGAEKKNPHARKKAYQEAMDKFDWDSLLLEELRQVKPNVILALGEMAMQGVTKQYGIDKYRGSILRIRPDWQEEFPNTKVIPTLHPRTTFKRYNSRVYVTLDYEKALRYRNDLKPYKENMLVWICRTSAGLRNYWNRVRKQPIPYYTCDIETYLGYITYIGFCFDGYEGISIPLLEKHIPAVEKVLLWQLIDEILRSKYPLVNQNIKYDVHWLEKWGFSPSKPAGDTMLAGHTLYPELPKNLGFYTSIYTDFPYHKDESHDFNPSKNPDQLGLYNAKDCVVTWKIYEEMLKDLKEFKTYHFYTDFVMPLFHTYRKIDARGILVDDTRRKTLLSKYKLLQTKHQYFLDTLANRHINVESYIQVGNFLYEDLKLPKKTKITESGRKVYVTSADVLEDIYIQQLGKDHAKSQIVKLVLGIRKLNKSVELLETLRVHPDGRLRTTYRLEGTESGRTSGSDSLDMEILHVIEHLVTKEKEYLAYQNYGHSFQTLPKHGYEEFEEIDGVLGKDILEMFVPSPGYAFVEGDGAQAEARVVAVLARDDDTLALMNKTKFKYNKHGVKNDLHTTTAMWTTAKPFKDIRKFDREKYGKRPRHAGNYDQGPEGLGLIIHRPLNECRAILTRFHENVPKLRSIYHRACVDYVRKYGQLTTPFGRRRDFFDKPNDKLWKVVYSYIPQSTISDHYKSCIIPMTDAFSEDEARVIVEKHDSLMGEVRLDKVKDWAEKFKKVSERPIDFTKGSLIRDVQLVIPSEVLFSEDCWTEDMQGVQL